MEEGAPRVGAGRQAQGGVDEALPRLHLDAVLLHHAAERAGRHYDGARVVVGRMDGCMWSSV